MNDDKSANTNYELKPVISVDDDSITLDIIERYYKKSNMNNPFLKFQTGDEFIEYLGSIETEEKPKPALVLLDINMPGLSGFDVLEHMRSKPIFKDVPVCSMLTSSTRQEDKDTAKALGADGFLVKPSRPREYTRIFNEFLAGKLEWR